MDRLFNMDNKFFTVMGRVADLIMLNVVFLICCHAEIKEEKIINKRFYHTIKEVKNGEGPHPIKTPQGWRYPGIS